MAGGKSGGLLHAGAASLAIKVSNLALGLAIAVLFARLLGPDGYGQYVFVLSIVTILAIPVQLGLPQLVVRETARADEAGKPEAMHALWRWAHLVVALAAAVISGLAILGSSLFGSGPAAGNVLLWGFALLPLVALGRIRGAALRGLGHVVLGQLPESVLRPLFLLGLVAAALFMFGQSLTASRAIMLHVLAALIAFAIGAALLVRHAPSSHGVPSATHRRRWLVAAGILGSVQGLQVLNQNLDLLMLGYFVSDSAVGVYKVATAGAGLVAFGLQAMTVVIMTRVTRLHAAGEMAALQKVVTAAARIIVLTAGAAAASLIVTGHWLLVAVFGEAFDPAYSALVILALGQFAFAAIGPVGMLLNMSGHERDTLRGVALACVANVGLNLVLIPAFGINGAAAATVLTLLLWHLQLSRRVARRLGIDSTVIRLFATPAKQEG